MFKAAALGDAIAVLLSALAASCSWCRARKRERRSPALLRWWRRHARVVTRRRGLLHRPGRFGRRQAMGAAPPQDQPGAAGARAWRRGRTTIWRRRPARRRTGWEPACRGAVRSLHVRPPSSPQSVISGTFLLGGVISPTSEYVCVRPWCKETALRVAPGVLRGKRRQASSPSSASPRGRPASRADSTAWIRAITAHPSLVPSGSETHCPEHSFS